MANIRLLSCCALGAIVLICGCGENDPAGPDVADSVVHDADEAVALFKQGLAELDSVALAMVLPGDVCLITKENGNTLGTEEISGELVWQALRRYCSKAMYENEYVIGGLDIQLAPHGDWDLVAAGSEFEGCVNRQYDIDIFMVDGGFWGYGTLRIYARSVTVGDAPPDWRIVAIDDQMSHTASKTESKCVADLVIGFLPGGLPHAVLTLDRDDGTTEMVLALDASQSRTTDAPLAPEPFRWRVDQGTWTAWQAESTSNVVFELPGTHTVTLEVRNELGSTAVRTCTTRIVASYPGCWQELLDTVAYAHEHLDLSTLVHCLDTSAFQFVLQDQDVVDFGWPSAELDVGAFITCVANIFSRVVYDNPAYVEAMTFLVFDAVATPSQADAIVTTYVSFTLHRPLSVDLSCEGAVELAVGPRSVVTPDGPTVVWQIQRISDHSGSGWHDTPSWGSVLLEYRPVSP